MNADEAAERAEKASRIATDAVRDALVEAGFDLGEVQFVGILSVPCDGGAAVGLSMAGMETVMDGVSLATDALAQAAEGEIARGLLARLLRSEEARRN